MRIGKAKPQFRPVTVVFETQDEWDKFIAILSTVAANRVNHVAQVTKAASDLLKETYRLPAD